MEIEIRSVIHFFFRKSYPPASTHAMIESVYGAGTITLNGVIYWYKEFKSGRTDLTIQKWRRKKSLNLDSKDSSIHHIHLIYLLVTSFSLDT